MVKRVERVKEIVSLAAEKTVEMAPAQTQTITEVEIIGVIIKPDEKKIWVTTNLGALLIASGATFPTNWSITKTQVITAVKTMVESGVLIFA